MTPSMKHRLAVVAFVGTLAAVARPDARADIFSYTDADGVVHFTNTPTKGAGADPWKLWAKSKDGPKSKPPGWHPHAFGGGGVERYTRYDETIREAAAYYQLPEAFVRAIIKVESDYDPRAVSNMGALGLMQLIPETAQRMQVRDPYDPRENILGGVRYLRVLANMFNGNLQLTLAGYNAGENAVTRHGGIPPFDETQDYVTRVLLYYRRYRAMRDNVAASTGSDVEE